MLALIAGTKAHYAKDKRGKYLFGDEAFLAISQIESHHLIGATDIDLPWAASAESMTENDQKIITIQQPGVFIEHGMFKGKPNLFRSIKFPFLGKMGQVLGVHCISMPLSDKSSIPLSHQQTLCLQQLAYGYTHKQIADNLGLSPKTIEHYITTVKIKLNCRDRFELVQQAIERGLISML